jgi:RNA polymerase-binding transcription factor DksA
LQKKDIMPIIRSTVESNENQHGETVRYSDTELEEFRQIIDKRLEKAQKVIVELRTQIMELTENVSDEHGGDWIDDSSINNEVEMLYDMMSRQQRYLNDLEHALIRIRNRTYGICFITGNLIDKRRLLAVPTTTKSLSAKITQQSS